MLQTLPQLESLTLGSANYKWMNDVQTPCAKPCMPCMPCSLLQLRLTCSPTVELLNADAFESLHMCTSLEQLTLPQLYAASVPHALTMWVKAARHVHIVNFQSELES